MIETEYSNLFTGPEMHSGNGLIFFKTIGKRYKIPRMVEIFSTIGKFHVSVSIGISFLIRSEQVVWTVIHLLSIRQPHSQKSMP